jgi:hypothetical protein
MPERRLKLQNKSARIVLPEIRLVDFKTPVLPKPWSQSFLKNGGAVKIV